jgi:glutathione S-transferase
MTATAQPILYSFRRCPYAMRARMALYSSNQICTHREVVLRDKPNEMIAISPKATVPVLEVSKGEVIDQSLDIMLWALRQDDPDRWLKPDTGALDDMLVLITQCEAEFKPHLDRYKYANRYSDADPITHRSQAEGFLFLLERRLTRTPYLFGNRPALADFAIFPFIRQFANTDRYWFDQTPYPSVHKWLAEFLESDIFTIIMKKYAPWKAGDDLLSSPTPASPSA